MSIKKDVPQKSQREVETRRIGLQDKLVEEVKPAKHDDRAQAEALNARRSSRVKRNNMDVEQKIAELEAQVRNLWAQVDELNRDAASQAAVDTLAAKFVNLEKRILSVVHAAVDKMI